MDYLPNNATIDEACEWLQHQTGQKWTLPRLLEDGHLRPYVWLDCIEGYPQISGSNREGHLTEMVYHGDVMRLAADRNDALLTMFTAHDGTLVSPDPAWRVELKDIRFKKKALERVAEIINKQKTAPAQTETPAPVVADGASGGVKPDKAGPLPLTTGDIAFCFAGLRWDEQQWKKPLGDKRKWLAACIAIPGARGVSETRWNPVLIGAALEREGHAKQNRIRARFQTMPQLSPWRDAWKTYEADNFDTE